MSTKFYLEHNGKKIAVVRDYNLIKDYNDPYTKIRLSGIYRVDGSPEDILDLKNFTFVAEYSKLISPIKYFNCNWVASSVYYKTPSLIADNAVIRYGSNNK